MNGVSARDVADSPRGQAESRALDHLQIGFIVGPPKCGTTWVMRSLDGHPNAVARGESSICRALLPNLTAAFRYYNAHQTKYGNHRLTMFSDEDFRCFLRHLVERQLLRYVADGNASGDVRTLAVLDKSPSHSQHVDFLAGLFPRAKFICCTRDVRDGAVSGWHHFAPQGWLKQRTIEEYARVYAAQTWAPMMRDARAGGSRLGSRRYTEIEFADHKARPQEQVRRLLRFIGLPDAEAHVHACVEAGSFVKASGGRESGVEDPRSFIRKGVVGDWENHFSPEFGAELLESAGSILTPGRLATA